MTCGVMYAGCCHYDVADRRGCERVASDYRPEQLATGDKPKRKTDMIEGLNVAVLLLRLLSM